MEEQNMNYMEQNTSEKQMVITREGESYLKKTSGWTIFLAVMFFVSVAWEFISFIVYAVTGEIASMLMAIISAALYVAPAIFLMLFAVRAKKSLVSRSQEDLSSSLLNFKRFWVYYGIWQIVGMSLLVLALIVVAVALCIFF